MHNITVITPTIGRASLIKLVKSLTLQNVNITHLMMWDNKREEKGYLPNDNRISQFETDNYKIYHYVIEHPVVIGRKDNYLRTVGLMMSNTEYITQIDDDCWIENDWLNRAINNIITSKLDYCFCIRRLWENEDTILGIDNYESIGIVNSFGYNLIETNSIVFNKGILNDICSITQLHNNYGHDRKIGKFLIENKYGMFDTNFGLNQIVPEFLLNDHKQVMKKILENK